MSQEGILLWSFISWWCWLRWWKFLSSRSFTFLWDRYILLNGDTFQWWIISTCASYPPFQGKTKAEFSRVAKEKSISKLYFSKYLIYIMKTVKILLDPAIRTNRFAFWYIFKLILSTSCSLISNMYWWLNHFEVIKQSIIDSRYTHNSGQMEKLGYSEWNKWD